MEPIKLQATFEPGEYIFTEGAPADCAYIIDSGRVDVSFERDGQVTVMATLGQGDILGEMAINGDIPRSASALAVVETVLTEIPLDYVRNKIEQSDPTVRMFLRLAMARYQDLDDRLKQVLESLSSAEGKTLGDSDGSRTMELISLSSHLIEMQKRIDSAVTKSTQSDGLTPYSEETLQISKLLVTEEKLLREAMSQKQFRLHYQPIIDLARNRIVGCEALVRWHHPSGELVLPSRFLTQVENSDLIMELGYWIAEQACRFQGMIHNDLHFDFFVAINLSGKQFNDQMLIQNLADIMDRSGARRERIKFEITESLLIDNPDLATQALHELKDTGAKLAIDDFGTGYSSFSYLHRFPFDTLKIDRAFVNSMSESSKSERIVKSLINLAHDLGMNVVAEGIESRHEADMLRDYKTEYGQGFYYSRPISEADFIKLLQRPRRQSA